MHPFIDDTPTGPILGLLPTTQAMPRIKPLPPNLAWELAVLRPHLELVSARLRDFTRACDVAQAAIADVLAVFDTEIEDAPRD